jgi:dienelactone hydrolase
MFSSLKIFLIFIAFLSISQVSMAYEDVVFDLKELRSHGSIKFESTVKQDIGPFTNISNTVFKPKGTGPFPAVVLVHTCGGLRNNHIKEHAQLLLSKGFVVLVQDSFSPRGSDYCRPGKMVPARVGTMDAYDALKHLHTLDFVDKNRIYEAGFSWGAVIAQLLSSKSVAEKLEAKSRFNATVSFYGTCFFNNRIFAPVDADQPVLMLIAGKDREQNLDGCVEYLQEIKTKGANYEWYTYSEASHGWDKQGESRNGYFYDVDITKNSIERMIEFFDKSK